MKAAQFETFGPARDVLVVREWEKPSPGPGEVLVRLVTSGINPSDVKKGRGSAPGLLDSGPVIRLVIVYEMPELAKEVAVIDISSALEQERLQHRVTRVGGLSHIVQSHELVEQAGFRGCVVLDI